MNTLQNAIESRAWLAMKKFAADAPLTEAEWHALSELTLVDRRRLSFEPGNIRWATTNEERADNRRFYQSLGRPPEPGVH